MVSTFLERNCYATPFPKIRRRALLYDFHLEIGWNYWNCQRFSDASDILLLQRIAL